MLNIQTFLLENRFAFVLYLILAFFANKYSETIFIIAALVYTIATTADIIFDTNDIKMFILFRFLFVYAFGRAIPAGAILKAKMKELKKLGVPDAWLEAARKLKNLPSSRTL